MERFWYALTETCLAFTVFRDDFNPKFVALFTVLLFLKSFHWLAEDRVDYVSTTIFNDVTVYDSNLPHNADGTVANNWMVIPFSSVCPVNCLRVTRLYDDITCVLFNYSQGCYSTTSVWIRVCYFNYNGH